MKIAVVADERLKEELLNQGVRENTAIEWLDTPALVPGADAYIDLLFKSQNDRIETWKTIRPGWIVVHSVIDTLAGLPANFVRINAWPTFLKRPVIEAAVQDASLKEKTETLFSCFSKTMEWVPDLPGFISARVVSMIVNEAYFALQDKVSSKEEIDTAMKLGTNYPYGPFEWSKKIGLENISELLTELSKTKTRYAPATLLKHEAVKA